MKSLILPIVAITLSCAPALETRSRPVTGALGRQCNGPVLVLCAENLGQLCGAAKHAVLFWNQQVPGRIFFVYQGTFTGTPGFGPGVLYISKAETSIEGWEKLPNSTLAFAPTIAANDDSGCSVQNELFVLPRLLTEKAIVQNTTLIHEFGHILGLPHNDFDRESLMWPSVDGRPVVKELSTADLVLLQALYGF